MSKGSKHRKRQARLAKQARKLAKNAPAGPPSQASVFQTRHEAFSGPIPPPKMLEQYNNIIPNGADRIMKMAENQIVHRHQLETKVVDNNITAARVGQWLAFIIGMTTIVGGFYLISIDKDVYGVATLITAVVALVSVFIYGRKKQQEERAQKMQLLPEKLKA